MRGEEPVVIEALKMRALPEGNYGSRCGVYGVALNAPKSDENPSGMQGNKDEAMTSSYMNPCKS
ncbi:MAG: hypothetical protein NO483_05070 [Candidatus Methanomethylicia archaeon]|nr:hypothetical protein [Candidatus Methanomethylicia archaeon]